MPRGFILKSVYTIMSHIYTYLSRLLCHKNILSGKTLNAHLLAVKAVHNICQTCEQSSQTIVQQQQ